MVNSQRRKMTHCQFSTLKSDQFGHF